MKGWFFMGRIRRSKLEAFRLRFPNEQMPAGPLRALRYTSAGGQHTEVRNGRPISALLKVAFDYEGKNVYSNKIVIMDEVHNLVRTQTRYGTQLEKLRDLLFGARGMVLGGFTGTPILNEPQEGQKLLDLIKGRYAVKHNNEGFLSSFPMRPLGLFPRSLPPGVPDAILTPKLRRQLVIRTSLGGEPLMKYDSKRQHGLPLERLQRYCNLCVHFGSFHDGKSGSRARILANMPMCAPKLAEIASDVARRPEKALVLVARNSGMDALLGHLRELGKSSQPSFGVATMDELAAFNSSANRHGERYRVLVANASTCSEGVSFFAVRRVHLADVPATPSAFVQAVGRAIRMYGHRGLPSTEQTVTTVVHVAGLPRWMRSSLGAWAFRAQKRREQPQEMESRARRLLRTLMRAHIRDLETLRARLQACSKARGRLGPEEVALFYEQIGLWEEAKVVRHRGKASGKQKDPKKAESSRKLQRQLTGASAAGVGSMKPAGNAQGTVEHWKRDPLVAAMLELHSAASTAEAEERMNLSPLSADEKALQLLVQRSRAFVPALAELRSKAVDFEVLQALHEEEQRVAQEQSDGESTTHEFGVSDSSGNEAVEASTRHRFGHAPGQGPLLLPPGWRTESTRKGRRGTECRIIVDPTGRRYTNTRDARKAIDATRCRENMQRQMSSRFAAMLDKRRSREMLQNPPAVAVPSTTTVQALAGSAAPVAALTGSAPTEKAELDVGATAVASVPPGHMAADTDTGPAAVEHELGAKATNTSQTGQPSVAAKLGRASSPASEQDDSSTCAMTSTPTPAKRSCPEQEEDSASTPDTVLPPAAVRRRLASSSPERCSNGGSGALSLAAAVLGAPGISVS
jgi:superfamily II DNA or RNA helicase